MTGQFCNSYIVMVVVTGLAFIFAIIANCYKTIPLK